MTQHEINEWLDKVKLVPSRFEDYAVVNSKPIKHGHWVSLIDCSNAGVYCSVCHKKVYKEDYAPCNKKNKSRSNYCPNCGAKMDEKEENY